MLTFLALGVIALAVMMVAGAGLLLGGLVWLVLLPIRLLFKLAVGLIGAALGVVLVPVLLLAAGVVVAALLAAVFLAALVPILPLAAVALLAWAVYRAVTPRPSPVL